METIRVLHVFHGMDCGGAENMIMNLYRRIDRSRIQFDFLVHTDKVCFFDKEISDLGGRIFHVPYFNGFNKSEYEKALNRLFNNNNDISVVHGHLGSCAWIYLNVAKKHGCFTIAHSHSSKPTNYSIKNLVYRVYSYKVRNVADYFFGCSQKAGEYRYGKKIVKSNRFKVLNNAIDTCNYSYNINKRECFRQKLGVSQNTMLIGHVGRFTYAKNHAFLLNIFKELSAIRTDIKLVLIGDGELRKDIEKIIKDYNIEDKVILTGVVNNVADYLQAMDVFVFPSRFEGLPVSVIEAQAADLPCIISNRITTEVIISDNVKTFSIDEGALKEWVNELNSITIRTSGVDKYSMILKANYDIESNARWLENFYKEHIT